MSDVNISKYRAQVIRQGSTPASPGFAVAEGQNPVDPSGSGQTHLPVTIATATTGLSITESQILSGAGLVSQYIRGDGSLADFPATTGGGSSVSYYLNGSVSQGTIGGVAYKQLNRTLVFGAGTDFTIAADGYIASFITDASDPNKLLIPAGNWNFETYFSASSNGGSPSFYVELYKYDGTTFTLIATSSSAPELIAFGTSLNPYYSTLAVPETVLALTDRLAIRYYVTHSGRTITLHTEDNHLCQIITTFTTGLTALNGLTAQVQNFAVGTSGTDFAIASATATHTFNLPTASASNRGALSSADWTTFNNKTSNLGTVTSVGLSSATSGVTIGSTPVTTSGTITLAIATASGSQNGLLSSTDWTTFNSKQNALTNPVTGTGASGRVAYWNGTNSITSDANLLFNGNILTVASTTNAALNIATSSTTGFSYLDFINSGASGKNYQIGIAGNSAAVGYANNFYFDLVGVGNIMTLTSGRNVLIGNQSDNGARLQVSGVSASSALSLRNTTGGTLADFIITENTGLIVNSYEGASARSIDFRVANLSALLIASTGAATFSSSVTAGGDLNITTGAYRSQGEIVMRRSGNEIRMGSGDGSDYLVYYAGAAEVMRITSAGNTQPGADNAYSLGASGIRWSAVWAANGTIQTSDEREKKDIIDSDLGLDFVNQLRPVSFKWKVGQNVVTSEVIKDDEGNPILDEEGNEKTEPVIIPREGKRTHYGLIAQEVEELLDGKDFGGFIHDEETDTKGLRYDQFVPLLIKSIQELKTEIDSLKNK